VSFASPVKCLFAESFASPAETPGTGPSRAERNGKFRNQTERNGKFRKVLERNGTFRNGLEICNSLAANAFPVLSRVIGNRQQEVCPDPGLPVFRCFCFFPGARCLVPGASLIRLSNAQAAHTYGAPRRDPKALHLYRARKPLRAQTCCHSDPCGHSSRPGRRPKISFSPDFAGRGG